jgi:hypothetical protein
MKRHRSGSGDYDRKRRNYGANQYSESRSGSGGSDASAEDDEVGHLNARPGDFIGERCASQPRAGGWARRRAGVWGWAARALTWLQPPECCVRPTAQPHAGYPLGASQQAVDRARSRPTTLCPRARALPPAQTLSPSRADEVLSESGKGTFGKVLLCEDHRLHRTVAIKVVRRIRKYTEAARIEADILSQVNRADPEHGSLCVRYYFAFEHDGHFCMVMEPLGPSLYDYVKANGYKPPPLYCVQAFADQLLTAVAFLHELRLVHTDLKLENVLLAGRDEFVRTDKPNSTRKPGRILAPKRTDIRRAWRGRAGEVAEAVVRCGCTRYRRRCRRSLHVFERTHVPPSHSALQ